MKETRLYPDVVLPPCHMKKKPDFFALSGVEMTLLYMVDFYSGYCNLMVMVIYI